MLRRITLSLALAACMGMAAAQAPSAAWTLPAPPSVPNIEWAPDGLYVLLSTDSSIEVLSGSTFAPLWSQYLAGAEPSLAATFGSDRGHINYTGGIVWARSGPGNTFTSYAIATGAVNSTHVFSDWTQNYLLKPIGGELLAYNVTDSGGVYTYNYRLYNANTFALIASGSLTHSDAGGLSMLTAPTGYRAGSPSTYQDVACFFNKILFTTTGKTATIPAPAAGEEAWTVGVDASGGLIQAIVSNPTTAPTEVGGQRLAAATSSTTGTVTWSSSSFTFPNSVLGPIPPITTLLSAPSLALEATGNNIVAFNYLTGNTVWTDQVVGNQGSPLTAFTFGGSYMNPRNGSVLMATGTTGLANCSLNSFVASASGLTGPTAVPGIIYGVNDVEPITGAGVLVDGASNYISNLSRTGATNWAVTGAGPAMLPKASPSGDLVTLISGNTINVASVATGALTASYVDTGETPIGTAWVSETEFIVVNSDGTWSSVSYSGSSTSLIQSYPASFFGQFIVTSDGHWAIGYGNGNLNIFDLTSTSTTPVSTPYSAYPTSANTARFVALEGGRFGSLEKQGNSLKWSIYTISNGTPSLAYTFYYTPPFAPSAGAEEEGDISFDFGVAAYFISQPSATTGTPTSELAIVRISDGKKLLVVDNVYSYISQLRLSKDRASLYVLLGGSEADQGLTSDQTGPQDLVALSVPTWIIGTSYTPSTTASGEQTTLLIDVSAPPIARCQVNLTSTNGLGTPTYIGIPIGKTSSTTAFNVPVVSSSTSYSTSCQVLGSTDAASVANLTVVPPTIYSVSFSPYEIVAGQSATGTISLTGIAASDQTISLSDTSSVISFPSTVTIPAGGSRVTFPVTSVDSTAVPTNTTFTATASGLNSTKTAVFEIVPTQVTGLTVDAGSVTGGDAVGVTVSVTGPAPANGFTVALSSNNAAISVPSTVTIPAGQSSVTVDATTIPVVNGTNATLTATLGKSIKTLVVTVTPPTLIAVGFEEHAVIGGTPAAFDILLSGAAATGQRITLNSTSSRITVPTSVTFTAGNSFQTFNFATTAGPDITVTVNAILAAIEMGDTLTIYPTN